MVIPSLRIRYKSQVAVRRTARRRFSWTASAIDALTMHGMQNIGKDGWSIERISFELERYNGFGYRRNHPTVKSPYLWSCTNHYTSGKYIGDDKFSMTAVSAQVGAMAVLKQLVADGVVKTRCASRSAGAETTTTAARRSRSNRIISGRHTAVWAPR